MAKKKPVKGKTASKKPKKAVKQAKKGKKTRKPNRYNDIRKAAAAYCRDKYGKPCTNKELNDIYRRLKKDYGEVPIREVTKNLDLLIGKKDEKGFPADLESFNWFDTESLVYRINSQYFKPNDKLIFDMNAMGEGVLTSTWEDFPVNYRDGMYDKLRNLTEKLQREGYLASDEIPQFEFDDDASNIKKRVFKWVLDVPDDFDIEDFEDLEDKPKRKRKKKKKKPSEPKEDKPKRTSLADKNKAKELLLEEFKLGLIDRDEYRAKAKKIEEMYKDGGII